MKKVLIVCVIVCLPMLAGCLESVGYFSAGAVAATELAKIQIEEAAAAMEEHRLVLDNLKAAIETGSLDDAMAVAAMIPADPADQAKIEQIVIDAMTAYHNANSIGAAAKEQAKEPGWYVALVLGLTAAYQKYRRKEEKYEQN